MDQWPDDDDDGLGSMPAPFASILDSIAEENLILKDKLATLKKERDEMAIILADIAYPKRGSERASWGLSGFTNAIVEQWQLHNLLDGVVIDPEREAEANKKIMIAAAAPELLALAKRYEQTGAPDDFATELSAAIAKAEGRPPRRSFWRSLKDMSRPV